MTTEIIISRESTMSAEGEHINRNSKGVFCETTGKYWPSIKDAAKEIGAASSYLSHVICNREGHYKGNVYKHMSEAEASIPALLARVQQLSRMEAKAKAYDTLMAEQEAARKAEEKRNAAIAKAEAKVARCEEISKRKHAEADRADELLNEAKVELDILKGNFE